VPSPILLVDARAAFGSGLGRYMRETVRAMARLGAFAEIVLAGTPAELAPFAAELAGKVRVIPNRRGRYAWDLPFRWPGIAAAVGDAHVTWFPHWDGAWQAERAVTTIHDLIAMEERGIGSIARRGVARAWIGRMIPASRALITGSETTAREIVKAFPESAERLQVIPHGVTEIFYATRADAPRPAGVPAGGSAEIAAESPVELLDRASKASSAATPPFLLCVANKKPHKNLEMAIRAFAVCARDDAALRLMLVGERFAHAEELRALAASLGVGDRVDDVAGLSDAALAWTYAHAEALLVTSRVEGFGMVALEAMACGAPVVVVDRPPLPDVVGDAAMIVPMDDVSAMAAVVTRLRRDAPHRADRVAAGRARAAAFTWQRTAERTAEVLLKA
jgi:glycosyltransferase involved in cell wall biosynthesis